MNILTHKQTNTPTHTHMLIFDKDKVWLKYENCELQKGVHTAK